MTVSMYVCSDLHGMYDIYEQMCNYIKPEDKVICLGDCGDRGYNGWELIKAVYNNPQFTYLMGNHEDMLVNAMEEHLAGYSFNNSLQLVIYNGGFETYKSWLRETDANKKIWYKHLKALPLKLDYYCAENGTIWHLTHAGYTPYGPEPMSAKRLLWDRKHFKDVIDAPDPNETEWNEVCVHGHTPIHFLVDELGRPAPTEPDIVVYADDHKIDIDNGSFATGWAVLLNLDTFEYMQFYDRTMEKSV